VDQQKLKNIINFFGKSLGFLGLIYIFYSLSQEYTWNSFIQQFHTIVYWIPLLIIINIFSIIIGIYAWHIMLIHYAKKKFPYLASYYYFSKTEIAKYLPGNIFHFLGRQALASKIGISQKEMAKTSLLFSFLLLTGTLLSSTFFAFLAQGIPLFILTLMGVSSIITIISLVYLYPSFPMSKKISMNIYLAISVALQGIILGLIVMYQSEHFTISLFFQCVSIYTVSWLIGFVTPGASGGLGIREGTFIAITSYLHISVTSEIIIFSVLLVRLINICVDVGLYLWTYRLEKKMKELEI